MKELRDLSLAEIAAGLRTRELRAREIAERCLENDRHDAYREVDTELTLRQADEADEAFDAGRDHGPLQGIPTSIKDLYGVAGFTTWAGTARRLPPRFERAGAIVRAIRNQLAVVTGKTHTVELAFGGIGTNPHHPTPQNPWSPDEPRAPGGSSAGAGVSLCEGSALLALGTDTAGSVRIPASWTGNAALKTTARRWPTDGIVPLSTTLDTAGLLARDVGDLVLAFEAVEARLDACETFDLSSWEARVPEPPEPSELVLGRCDTPFLEDCAPGVVKAYERALGELSARGVEIVSLEIPEADAAYELFLRGGPVAVELSAFLHRELPDWIDGLDPNVAARIAGARSLAAVEYIGRLHELERLQTSRLERLGETDAIVAPTVANSPPLLSDLEDSDRYRRENLLCLRNTGIVSYLGLCAVTLPIGLDALEMPVGLQVIGPPNGEAPVLAIAASIEGVLGRGAGRLGTPPGL